MSVQDNVTYLLNNSKNLETKEDLNDYLSLLESTIEKLNEFYANGNPLVEDVVYDTCLEILAQYKPNSKHLHQVWSEDDETAEFDNDLDVMLNKHPMLSIQTIKHMDDKAIQDFKNKLPLGDINVVVSTKENGFGIRTVMQYGYLMKGNTRGRTTNGKDITAHCQTIVGDTIDNLTDYEVVELRGELMLGFHNLETARMYNPSIKSAFSGVASMSRQSATEEEVKLLDIIFYDVLSDDLEFTSLSEKYRFLEDCGLRVPLYKMYTINRKTFESDIEYILEDMELYCEDYGFYTDGLVLTIDDIELFREFGEEDKFRLGNLALKMGKWEQDSYSGVIEEIIWKGGKNKKTPVARIEPVVTAGGNTVINVPLYAPIYILLLEAYVGNTIHFKYGGEAGVIPTTPDGKLLKMLN